MALRSRSLCINAAIDIGKIVLVAAPGPVPYTYGQILGELKALEASISLSGRLQPLAPLRNLLALSISTFASAGLLNSWKLARPPPASWRSSPAPGRANGTNRSSRRPRSPLRNTRGINPRGAGQDPYGRIGRSIPDVIAAYHEGCSLLSRSSSASV